MPRQYFTKVSRRYRQKEQPWYLHPLRYVMDHPVYFSVNRKTVTRAIWIGVFVSFIPIPMQMLVAVLLALLARVNIAVAAIGVWVTNPFTMVPLFYLAYRLGAVMLNMPIEPWPTDMDFSSFSKDMGAIWKATLYGGIFVGLSSATVCYIAANAIWRFSTAVKYRERRVLRRRRSQIVRDRRNEKSATPDASHEGPGDSNL